MCLIGLLIIVIIPVENGSRIQKQSTEKDTMKTMEKPMTNLPAIQSNNLIPTEHEMMVFQTMAKQAVTSKMYKGDEASIMAVMLSARELGIPPMAALNGGLNLIQGKVEISARMMSSLIRKSVHSIQEKLSTDEECILVGQRGDNKDTITCAFTIDEAKRAGLVKDGGNWKKFPKDMLYARCLSRLARRLFSDVIGIGYVEGEIKEAVYEVIEPVEVIDESKLLDNFLSQFSQEDANLWHMYMLQIKEKACISFTKIIEKYNKDPKSAQDKFNTWKLNNTKQAA